MHLVCGVDYMHICSLQYSLPAVDLCSPSLIIIRSRKFVVDWKQRSRTPLVVRKHTANYGKFQQTFKDPGSGDFGSEAVGKAALFSSPPPPPLLASPPATTVAPPPSTAPPARARFASNSPSLTDVNRDRACRGNK